MKLEIVHFDDLEVDEVDMHGVAERESVDYVPILSRTDHRVFSKTFVEIDTTIDRIDLVYAHQRSETFHCDL